MIHKNIVFFRKKLGFSQESLAERLGVSRQTVAKWESGESIPDIQRCADMAEIFDVTLDDLVNMKSQENGALPPKGKYVFGTVCVGEKGQIVIPVKARRVFNIKPGDDLIVLGDVERGLALMHADFFLAVAEQMRNEHGAVLS
ncbi:MAG: helix-turn-helix domain-containing protein [Clostridia bacterium]|nr:helix-turn-helix domain-containing protein [Clostridia bacterium]